MKFKVTQEPGTFIHKVGFFRVGEVFDLPPGYVPSRHLVPVDEEARKLLKETKEAYLKQCEKEGRKLTEAEREELLAIPDEPKEAQPPPTPKQAAKTEAPKTEAPKAPTAEGGAKRAADR